MISHFSVNYFFSLDTRSKDNGDGGHDVNKFWLPLHPFYAVYGIAMCFTFKWNRTPRIFHSNFNDIFFDDFSNLQHMDKDGGTCAVVKAACKIGDCGFDPHSDLHVSSPLTRIDSISWGAPVTER